MNLQNTVDKMNYELWEVDDLISFYLTDTTCIQSIGIYFEGSDILLWNSEEFGFESEAHVIGYLKEQIDNLVNKLSKCSKVLEVMING